MDTIDTKTIATLLRAGEYRTIFCWIPRPDRLIVHSGVIKEVTWSYTRRSIVTILEEDEGTEISLYWDQIVGIE